MSRRTTPASPAAPALLQIGPVEQLRAGRLPRRLGQLFVGLSLYGVSLGIMVRATLGLDPWDVLHDGLSRHLPWSFGTILVAVSFGVLLAWIPLRQMPGLGTVANAVWVGVATDLTLATLAPPHSVWLRAGLLIGGVVLNGVASGLYIGSQLGPGPRDGLMTGINRRTGISLRAVRTGIEVGVLAVGWMLGGVVGVGTVLYALAIGPLVQVFLPWFTVRLENPRAALPENGPARQPE